MIKIPYVEGWLQDETRAWGRDANAEFVRIEERDDAYYDAIVDWWAQDGDLLIVEQDILPGESTAEEMLACPHRWCAAWYMISVVTGDERRKPTTPEVAVPFGFGLGCTKFAHDLRRDFPDLGYAAGEPIVFGPEPDPDPPKHWTVCDARLTFRLMRLGYLPHDHGEVRHLR